MQRRTLLRLGTAALGAMALVGYEPSRRVWKGRGFGSDLSVTFHDSGGDTEQTFAEIEHEVDRLEDVFSLFRPHSSLSQLNRDGTLDDPPVELVEVLELSRLIWSTTEGLFDPTVQSVWRVNQPARNAVLGFENVEIRKDLIRFRDAGMALTLNGIAQGYASDRLAQMLHRHGHSEHLINLGEFAAGEGAWRLAIENDQAQRLAHTDLQNLGLATSSPSALTRANGEAHIIHPFGKAPMWSTVSIEARSSAMADGLSTALTLMPKSQIDRLDLKSLGVTKVWLEDENGVVTKNRV
ncbi:FAD:protein FMN transferase [Aliiroseovarius sp. KMU-50]|uniref:FAD:protein FMN transferase n=1 Tax=Aliiroseovarius salicola TaxID=3009082 RepID=A0ABT4W2C2_9RHOB|nr:FAD:protein FMN transferase [Aliiroseovarius sp. KMU-50]MDA5094665.1 FAD:protein FMN transferase [Aliiroseovarius sp. KMU-50]